MRSSWATKPLEQFHETRVRSLRSGAAKRMRCVKKAPVLDCAHSGRVLDV